MVEASARRRLLAAATAVVLATAAGTQPVSAEEPTTQWAFAIIGVSSAVSTSDGSQDQATDQPDSQCQTGADGFDYLSWRPWEADRGQEWVALRYATPMVAQAVEIHEGLNPGAVVAVELLDPQGAWQQVWAGTDNTSACPGVLRVEFAPPEYATTGVKVVLNTALVPGHNQIDAVGLVGTLAEAPPTLFDVAVQEAVFPPTQFAKVPVNVGSYTVADYDNDGWPDLLATNADDYPLVLLLLHNEGNGTYSNRGAILPLPTLTSNAGRLLADFDNDGDLDAFLAHGSVVRPYFGPDKVFRNDQGSMIDISTQAGFADSVVSGAALAFDYDRDGWLDILVGHGTDNPDVATAGYSPANTLHRNDGQGHFADVSAAAGLGFDWDAGHPTLGTCNVMLPVDVDDDGWLDIAAAVSYAPDLMLRNTGLGSFADMTPSVFANPSVTIGLAAGDIDNDGDLDLFQAVAGGGVGGWDTESSGTSALLRNLGTGQFEDITQAAGLAAAASANIVFARLADIDNDMDLDLLISIPPMVYLNNGSGNFVDVTARSGLAGAYGLADHNGDGWLDTWYDQLHFVNHGGTNHYLRIDLQGVQSNRDGIGARVYATAGGVRQTRELICGDGWFQDELVVHFGLAGNTQVDELEIRWPSGQVDHLSAIPADQEIRVIEGRGEWYPAARTVWTVAPPASVTYGQQVTVQAACRPTLFEPTASIVRVTGNLSGLGGPADVALTDRGDGTYALNATFTVSGLDPLRDVEVMIEQETSLGPWWTNLSRAVKVAGDPLATAVVESRADAAIPAGYTLGQNWPNPFNAGTTIEFGMAQTGPVELAVYNLAGQRVVTLVSGTRPAGQHRVVWDGRDQAGNRLASGVYPCALTTPAGQQVRSLVLVQ